MKQNILPTVHYLHRVPSLSTANSFKGWPPPLCPASSPVPNLRPNPISVQSPEDPKGAGGCVFQVKVELTGTSNHLFHQQVSDICVPGITTRMTDISSPIISTITLHDRYNCPHWRAQETEAWRLTRDSGRTSLIVAHTPEFKLSHFRAQLGTMLCEPRDHLWLWDPDFRLRRDGIVQCLQTQTLLHTDWVQDLIYRLLVVWCRASHLTSLSLVFLNRKNNSANLSRINRDIIRRLKPCRHMVNT